MPVIEAEVSNGELLLIGTDGIWDPLGPTAVGLVGDLLRKSLLPTPPSLSHFARVTDFSKETWDDDRTLVAVWPASVMDIGLDAVNAHEASPDGENSGLSTPTLFEEYQDSWAEPDGRS
jgi:hypothetical protein